MLTETLIKHKIKSPDVLIWIKHDSSDRYLSLFFNHAHTCKGHDINISSKNYIYTAVLWCDKFVVIKMW